MNKIINLNLKNIIFYLFSISITFYLAKITQLSPVYVIYLALFPLVLLTLFRINKVMFSKDVIILIIMLFYILITQLQHIFTGEFINLFISIYAYISIRFLKYKFDTKFYFILIKHMILVSIFTLSIDSVFRISNPMIPNMDDFEYVSENDKLWFYIYKFNTLMFADSNTVALVVLTLFFTLSQIQTIYKINYVKEKSFLFLLLLFTFSRSAYIAFTIGFFYEKFLKLKKIKKIFLFLVITLFIVIFISYSYSYFESDGSFNSKFKIISLVYEKFLSLSLFEILFGIGFGNSKEFLGIYTHLLFLTYFVESGLFGLLILIIFLTIYSFNYGSIIILPLMIAGLSYFAYLGTPFIFVPLAIFANLYDLRRKENCKIN